MFLFPGPSIELFDDTSFASLFEHQAGTQPIHHPDDTLHLDQKRQRLLTFFDYTGMLRPHVPYARKLGTQGRMLPNGISGSQPGPC